MIGVLVEKDALSFRAKKGKDTSRHSKKHCGHKDAFVLSRVDALKSVVVEPHGESSSACLFPDMLQDVWANV